MRRTRPSRRIFRTLENFIKSITCGVSTLTLSPFSDVSVVDLEMTIWRIRGKIIRTVLCCIVLNYMLSHMSSSYGEIEPVGLRLVLCVCLCVFFNQGQFVCLRVVIIVTLTCYSAL